VAAPFLRSGEDDIADAELRAPSPGTAHGLVQSAAALLELPLLPGDAELITDLLSRLQARMASIPQQFAEPSGPEDPAISW
jgi:hypothetical protein